MKPVVDPVTVTVDVPAGVPGTVTGVCLPPQPMAINTVIRASAPRTIVFFRRFLLAPITTTPIKPMLVNPSQDA